MNREFIHDDLSAATTGPLRVALARVAEESGELLIEAMKAQRFGPENRYPADGPTNIEKMRKEFGDVEAALVDAGVLGSTRRAILERVHEIREELHRGIAYVPIDSEAANALDRAAERAVTRIDELLAGVVYDDTRSIVPSTNVARPSILVVGIVKPDDDEDFPF